MREAAITVTEAARNFADCVNRVHYQNQTYLLLKNGVPFARLVPAGPSVCHGRDLAAVLATVNLTEEEAESWRRDLKAGRKKLTPPKDKWQ